MNQEEMLKAFKALDSGLTEPLRLVIGGGAAMLLTYGHKEATSGIDATPQPFQAMGRFETLIEKISEDLGLPKDWLNTHFTDFTYVVPETFSSRVRAVYSGKNLVVDSFGPEDIAIMKLMAARPKDRPHLRRLFRLSHFDFSLIEEHLLLLKERGLTQAERGLDLMDELRDEL